MPKSKRKISISRAAIIFVLSVYFINLCLGFRLNEYFILKPELVVDKLELWRIFTFPLACNTIEGTLLFAFTFYIIGYKIETNIFTILQAKN